MRIVTGCFAILFGAVGVLIALAATGLVWWGAFLITAQTEKVTSRADGALLQAEEGISALRQPLASTAKTAEEVRASAAKAAEGPNTPDMRAEVEHLRTKLFPLVEQTEVISAALPPIAKLLDNATNLAEGRGQAPRAARLRSIAGKVREAEEELGAVRTRVAALREGESAPTAKEVADLARRTQKPLDRLVAALSEVQQESAHLRGELPEVRRMFNGWVYIAAAILTGILFWIGVGQLTLVGWGRRRLMAPVLVASQPPTSASPSLKP